MITQINKRSYAGLDSSPGHVKPGESLVDKVFDLIAANNLLASGQGTILDTATAVVVAVGAQFDGATATVSFGEAPTAAIKISSAPVSGGNLTITIDQDNTAERLVNWALDGRS